MPETVTRNYFSSMAITINGHNTKAKLLKCDYSLQRAQNGARMGRGTIYLELLLDVKEKELLYWSPESTQEFSGTIVCKTSSGDVVRTLSFVNALSQSFSETIDVNIPKTIITKVHLDVARLTVS